MSGRLSGAHALQVSISKVLIVDLTREVGIGMDTASGPAARLAARGFNSAGESRGL
jgi:hypothetical protein